MVSEFRCASSVVHVGASSNLVNRYRLHIDLGFRFLFLDVRILTYATRTDKTTLSIHPDIGRALKFKFSLYGACHYPGKYPCF